MIKKLTLEDGRDFLLFSRYTHNDYLSLSSFAVKSFVVPLKKETYSQYFYILIELYLIAKASFKRQFFNFQVQQKTAKVIYELKRA